MRVYRSKDVPADLHFSISSSRMPPLVVIPDDGWYLVHREGTIPSAGDHGYPMNFTDMNPFFLAHGPSFLINKTIPEVHAVDIYSLLTGLLGLPAQPNNGSMARIAHALLKPDVAETVLHTPVWFPRWWAWFMLQLHMVWIFIGVALWAVLLGMVLSLFYAQRRHIRMLAIYDTTWNGVTA
ncbi:Phosphodiesterase-nucleotide pyrophosphatase [Fasciola hepatica]|uniref:Phosphodiesterase-nucleotide pyrophosphatase n=1 Tax=Fasciola hepatica TaxID=6192 RepID=A0A4E0RD76_FASHE|nr:Phosphodiesterase-nucleotide pyrophosphatase [Fasciola hepatica]